ncbi:transposase [Arthrobacter sp. UYCu511]|uniref:transposase n=1 Tax=Arthrobacter sp. UYCu511 TaxID=3156337 RepID=UPI003397167F
MGLVTVGIILAAYSHQGRVRSEAAFAALAGTSPLQASSGNIKRHRLNRGGTELPRNKKMPEKVPRPINI